VIVTTKFRNSFSWFTLYVEEFGQFNPGKEEVHLLSFITKKTIWTGMVEEEGPKYVYCYSGFIMMILAHFTHVKWPREVVNQSSNNIL
jgi:hypothetical protein